MPNSDAALPDANAADTGSGSAPRGKILVFTAPSGAGKTTLVRHLLATFPDALAFSVSATTRAPRPHEVHGRDYYFLTPVDFAARVTAGEFLEHEEVYAGQHYGTLRAEVERLWRAGKVVVFDVEVMGATHLKELFGRAAQVVFVAPPSEEVLFARLRARGTEDEGSLRRRIARVSEELKFRDRFDRVLVNGDLAQAKTEATAIARAWLAVEAAV